jgi:hypothetical protein
MTLNQYTISHNVFSLLLENGQGVCGCCGDVADDTMSCDEEVECLGCGEPAVYGTTTALNCGIIVIAD